MCDWVAVMHHGKVVQWGTPWEIYYRPRTRSWPTSWAR